MNKQQDEKMARFRQEVKQEMAQALYSLHLDMEENGGAYQEKWRDDTIAMLQGCISKQKEKIIGPIGAIVYTLSRYHLYNKDYRYPVYIYGSQLYIDSYGCEGWADVSPCYCHFDSVKEKICQASKKYVGAVTAPEAENEAYQYIPHFNMYFVNGMRQVFQQQDVAALLQELLCCEEMAVLQNEIYEKPYKIY